ncbi:ATP-dependent DNA/RNA helicase [Parahypoxylon ruwenzoriense]
MPEPTGLIAKSGIELLTFGILPFLFRSYVNTFKNTQKEPRFTAINPNERISVVVDHDRGEFSVFEGLAISGGIDPAQAQVNQFLRLAKEKDMYAMQRYISEAERLYGVLGERLQGRDFIVGPGRGKSSIADISMFGWADMTFFSSTDVHLFSSARKWLKGCLGRPPVPSDNSPLRNTAQKQAVGTDPERKKTEEEALRFLDGSKEKYGQEFVPNQTMGFN